MTAPDADKSGEEFDEEEVPPDPSMTRELFLQWRSPRLGSSNPEPMTNPVWEWLVRSRINAYQATEHFDGHSAWDAGPGWCFDRLGQSSTRLPDGRVVLIAGEHEDFYDSDFYIYNDVVVKHPDGQVEIFGYPRDVFPPTDFHSATLVGNRIVIIGNLGYREQRKPGTTPVLVLELKTLAVSAAETCGTPPGWIHDHVARLSEDGMSIIVQRGLLDRGTPGEPLVENIDDWKLHIADLRWERLTDRRWQRWNVLRSDQRQNHLWEIQQAVWDRSVGWQKELEEKMEKLGKKLGIRPDLDQVANLFRPPIPHEEMPEVQGGYRIFRIKVDGVVIRYVVDSHSIQLTVEGDLAQATVEVITSDLLSKLSALENTKFVLTQI